MFDRAVRWAIENPWLIIGGFVAGIFAWQGLMAVAANPHQPIPFLDITAQPGGGYKVTMDLQFGFILMFLAILLRR